MMTQSMHRWTLLVVASVVLAMAAPAAAEIAVSTTDGKQQCPMDDVPGVTPDEVAVIDLRSYPPKVLGAVEAPTSLIGTDASIAVARDESFALVTANQKIDPADASKLVAGDLVSVIDLRDRAAPRLVQTVHAGANAGGVTLNSSGTLALVANAGDDSVTVFGVKDRSLTKLNTVQLPKGSGPGDVNFTPDGAHALIVRRGDHRVTVLKISGQKVADSGVEITPGRSPYGVVISPDSRFAYVTNLGGAATRAELDAPPPAEANAPRRPSTIAVLDLTTNTVVRSVEVGVTPEAVTLSRDGKRLAVVLGNGATVQKLAPNYAAVAGEVRVFSVDKAALTPMAQLKNGHWCQGAAFSDDGATLLISCAVERNIEVYRIGKDGVVRDDGATLLTKSRGASLSTARSR
jgi:6-phosphogluconolactonase (cycloisomerase 2 family)